MLKIGFAKKEFTPPARVTLAGQFNTRISTHVESKLYASAAVFEKDGEQLIIVSCDLGSIPADFLETVRACIRAESTAIDADKVIVSATHTHTAPVISELANDHRTLVSFLPEDMRFEDEIAVPDDVWRGDRCKPYVAERVADAVCAAYNGRKQGFLSPAFDRAVIGHCRRQMFADGTARMYGSPDNVLFEALESGSDSGIELLYAYDSDEKPIGALVNVACPSQVVEAKFFVSADYWGKARDKIEEVLGKDFVTVGLCSAAGCQSPRDLIRDKKAHPVKEGGRKLPRRAEPDMYDVEGAALLGGRVADVVLRNVETAKANRQDDPILQHERLDLSLPVRTVGLAKYEATRAAFEKELSRLRQENKTVLHTWDVQALHLYGGFLQRYETQTKTPTADTEVHIARLGDLAFATNPFELFLDYGNIIRARSLAAQTFLIQLACGAMGYLPTERAEKGGHYSAYVSGGTVGHVGGRQLCEETIAHINRMF